MLTTAFELLSESGVNGFTVDEVASRSGVAKTTIYRHWPTREALVPSIVDVAERDPEFADIHAKIQRGHAVAVREVIERAAGRGEIPATADRSAMVSALMGPLYYRRRFSREPIDDQFVTVIVRNVTSGQRNLDTRT